MSSPVIQARRWTRKEYDRLAEGGILHPSERVQLTDLTSSSVLLLSFPSPRRFTPYAHRSLAQTGQGRNGRNGQGIWGLERVREISV